MLTNTLPKLLNSLHYLKRNITDMISKDTLHTLQCNKLRLKMKLNKQNKGKYKFTNILDICS